MPTTAESTAKEDAELLEINASASPEFILVDGASTIGFSVAGDVLVLNGDRVTFQMIFWILVILK